MLGHLAGPGHLPEVLHAVINYAGWLVGWLVAVAGCGWLVHAGWLVELPGSCAHTRTG